jgi:hypothetical protein
LAKKQHTPIKNRNYFTFPVFLRFRAALPIAKHENTASMACVSWPRADANHVSLLRTHRSTQRRGNMRKRQEAIGTSTGNLFAISFQPGGGQVPSPDSSGGIAQPTLLFVQGACTTPEKQQTGSSF